MSDSLDGEEAPINIRQLVNECRVALRLEQHYKVSSICLHMIKLLVELYDRELLDQEEDEDFDDDDDEEEDDDRTSERFFTPEWNFISAKCRQLRHFSQIAETYGDVLEFVRVRDLVCLGELVGANPRRPDVERQVQLDIELLSRTLRQCVILLKELSGPPKTTTTTRDQDKNVWISTDKITRIRSVSFPRHLIDLEEPPEEGERENVGEFDLETSTSLVITEILRAEWFEQFWHECLADASYPLDRFPILVALWIIASESQHGALEHLMSELVDQIYHQETNSCHQDELMQLTQVGSFWLSHKKRFSVTMKGRHTMDEQSDLEAMMMEDDDIEDDEEEENGNEIQRHATDDQPTATRAVSQRTRFLDFRPLLRSMIDNELLVGQPCLLCAREPSGDPLEPIHLSTCPKCSLNCWPNSSSAGALFCCLSLQPIQWLSLANLLEALTKLFNSPGQVTQLLVLTPNEYAQRWMRAAMSADDKNLFAWRRRRQLMQSDQESNGTADYREQIDISEKFQRLRVLRNNEIGDDERTKSPSLEREVVESSSSDEQTRRSFSTRAANGDNDDDEDEDDFENFSQDGAPQDEELAEDDENKYQDEADKRARNLESCLADLSTFLETRFRFAMLRPKFTGDEQQQRRELDASQHVTGANYLAAQWLQLSETLQLMKLAFRHAGANSTASAVYSGDLVALDALHDERLPSARSRRYVSLYLVARRPRPVPPTSQASDKSAAAAATGGDHYLASGICGTSQPVFACSMRSRTSALQLGCGRLFSPLELIRVGCHRAPANAPPSQTFRSRRLVKYLHWPPWRSLATAQSGGPTCPACRCQLVALRTNYLSS